jgi:predicted CoA-binding protein
MLTRQEIIDLLQGAHTIAIVGLSDNADRPSYGVATYLQREGYQIIPVNPNLRGPLFGVEPVGSLREITVPVDIVQIFRRPEYVSPIVDDAIAIGAKAVWMQLGIVNETAAARGAAAGLKVVMNRCMAVEHRLLIPRSPRPAAAGGS